MDIENKMILLAFLTFDLRLTAAEDVEDVILALMHFIVDLALT